MSPAIETDSILALTTHVLTGERVSVVSSLVVGAIDLSERLRVVPIYEPELAHSIALVVSKRCPIPPAIASLLQEARKARSWRPDVTADGRHRSCSRGSPFPQ